MRVALGSDHAGVSLRARMLQVVQQLGHEAIDVGTHDTAPTSYVTCAQQVAQAIQSGQANRGILICGTGLGVSMAANRLPGMRAALCTHEKMAEMARAHNDANIVCLGERIIGVSLAESIVNIFLATPFAGGRHMARLEQLAGLTEVA